MTIKGRAFPEGFLLQPAGKPKMTITDYLNGAADKFATGEQVINK